MDKTSAPALRGDLEIKPVTKSGGTVYYVKDVQAGSVYEFSAQEHALLAMLDGKTGLDDLRARFERQHGVALALDELQEFIGNLREWGLLAGQSPQTALTEDATAVRVPAPSEVGRKVLDKASGAASSEPSGPERSGDAESHPARYWRLFESDAFFARVAQSLMPLRNVVYALPVLLAVALFVVVYHSHDVLVDYTQLFKPLPFIMHLLITPVTVNICSRFMAGVVCRGMGGEVPGFGIAYRGVVVKFEVELRGVGKMTRRQQMWIHATPLLVKVLLFSVGILLWVMARASGSAFAVFGFILAGISVISFALTVNPLGKTDGYELVSAYLGMPRLRKRTFGMLFSNFLPGKQRQDLERAMQGIDVRAFRIYAMVSLLFSVALLGALLLFAALWLEWNFAGFGVVVFIAIVAVLAYRMWDLLAPLRATHAEGGTTAVAEPLGARILSWTRQNKKKVGALILFLVVSILPYQYQPGGDVELRAAHHMALNAQTEGIIEEVYFKGGEWVSANTVVARLAYYQYEKAVGVTRAQISQEEATLDKLLTTPRPEEVALSEAQVELNRARADYQKIEFKRQEKLYEKQVISEHDYMQAKEAMDKAVNEFLVAQANLVLLLAGPHPDQIAAARAELERLRETLRYDEEKLRRTRLVMPIDGHLTATHLYDLVGRYVKEGDLISEIDDDRTMLAEIQVPESDVEGVRLNAEAQLKIWTYPVDLVRGKVTYVDPVTMKGPSGKVVKVTFEVPNKEFLMKSGMTGYGKVSTGYVPAISAFTHWLVRFFTVEVWSWIP